MPCKKWAIQGEYSPRNRSGGGSRTSSSCKCGYLSLEGLCWGKRQQAKNKFLKYKTHRYAERLMKRSMSCEEVVSKER